MMDQLLPLYRHPALTILVDDSQTFLESLAFQLHQRVARKVFHEPAEAIAWLRESYQRGVRRGLPIDVDYDEQTLSFDRRVIVVDIDQIYRLVMNPARFLLPAVLAVDYAMPSMNGVALCDAVGALPCKKILFTGQADETVAIDAFNRGLIDRFIKKSEHGALDVLEAEIRNCQNAFFFEQSRTLKELLVYHSHSFLSDPAVAALVEQLCKKYDFIEYYLFPNPEGILFIDFHGKPTLMVLETEAGMLAHYEAARDNDAPAALQDALREMRLLPFFSETGMYSSVIEHDWLSYCLPAQFCAGRQDYYWALFDLPSRYLPRQIYSFADFLRDQAVVQ